MGHGYSGVNNLANHSERLYHMEIGIGIPIVGTARTRVLTSLGLHLVADPGALEIHIDESEIVLASLFCTVGNDVLRLRFLASAETVLG